MDRAFLVVRRRLWRSTLAVRGQRPRAVFIVGSGRSGTDLLVTSLAQSLDVATFNEDHPAVFLRWKLRDLPEVKQAIYRIPSQIALLKPIVETDRTQQLLEAFPGSRALYVVRHYHDTIASRIRFFSESQVDTVAHWIRGDWTRFPLLPQSIREVAAAAWHEAPTVATAAGINWLVVNSCYSYLSLGREPRVRLLSYASLIADPEATIRGACEFVGLRYRRRMIREIDPAVARANTVPALPAGLEASCARLWQEFLCALKAQEAADLLHTRRSARPENGETAS